MGDLVEKGPDGRESVQSGMRELVACGYAKLETGRDESGQIVGSRYHIFEDPEGPGCEKPKSPTSGKTGRRENREAGKPGDGKPGRILKKNSLPKTQRTQDSAGKGPELFDSLAFQASAVFFDQLLAAGVSHAEGLMRQGRRDETIRGWSDTFDKLTRLDGHSWEEVRMVMQWLFHRDDWWVSNGNVQTATKLRKKDSEGVAYFARFLSKARQSPTPTPDPSFRAATL